MNKLKFFGVMILMTWLSAFTAYPQTQTDRNPYAAGRFYEADSARLINNLRVLFGTAQRHNLHHILALICPHAGYAYSGEVAATGYKQLNPEAKYDNIFLIGSSHTMYLDGASVYSAGNYLTPLGEVKVNTALAKQLIAKNKYISFVPQAHGREHSLENQLPFLQYYLKNPFRIVPVIIGTNDKKELQSIAATLKPYLNDKNLFIISSDFSHYPRYHNAQNADSTTARGILTNNPEKFIEALRKNSQKDFPGLVTSACGQSSILTLLYMTQNMPNVHFVPLKYMNSGDVAPGDKSRVVGYFSIALVDPKVQGTNDFLTLSDKKELLRIARTAIEDYINKKQIPEIDKSRLSKNLMAHSGAFVTLNEKHSLRGCIGRFTADEPLYQVVQQMAIAAATQDYRFQVVRPSELPLIDIEISVLTPMKKINSIEEIKLGRDGIYIVKGNHSGTFLPQVATETGWTREEFLGHCAQDKAGIGWDGWKEAEIYTYQAIVFDEKELGLR